MKKVDKKQWFVTGLTVLEKEGFAKDSIDKYLSLFEEVTEDVNGVRRLKELLEGFLDQKIAEELETIILRILMGMLMLS